MEDYKPHWRETGGSLSESKKMERAKIVIVRPDVQNDSCTKNAC